MYDDRLIIKLLYPVWRQVVADKKPILSQKDYLHLVEDPKRLVYVLRTIANQYAFFAFAGNMLLAADMIEKLDAGYVYIGPTEHPRSDADDVAIMQAAMGTGLWQMGQIQQPRLDGSKEKQWPKLAEEPPPFKPMRQGVPVQANAADKPVDNVPRGFAPRPRTKPPADQPSPPAAPVPPPQRPAPVAKIRERVKIKSDAGGGGFF